MSLLLLRARVAAAESSAAEASAAGAARAEVSSTMAVDAGAAEMSGRATPAKRKVRSFILMVAASGSSVCDGGCSGYDVIASRAS